MTPQLGRLSVHVLPTSRAGWSSVALLGLSLAAFAVFFWSVQAGGEGYLLNFAGVGAAVAGAVVAIAGVLRSHERGLLVALPVLWGLAWGGFLAGEFVNPH